MCFPPSAEGRERRSDVSCSVQETQKPIDTRLLDRDERCLTGPWRSKITSQTIGGHTGPVPHIKERFECAHCVVNMAHHVGGPLVIPEAAANARCDMGRMRSSKTIGVPQSGQAGT